MVTKQGQQRDAVFRAIADPTRREILSLLRGRQSAVGEIAANFRSSRPAISKHLRLPRGRIGSDAAARGGAETMYPEYQQQLAKAAK